ncbi:hypothetical protein TNCV_4273611 [Trichonephila clavipes]|nr:hypothetical protein TNCV_4273611 [Trichonephila clavipes]
MFQKFSEGRRDTDERALRRQANKEGEGMFIFAPITCSASLRPRLKIVLVIVSLNDHHSSQPLDRLNTCWQRKIILERLVSGACLMDDL